MRSITLQQHERKGPSPFYVVRLAGSGAGEAEEGERCRLVLRQADSEAVVRVVSTEVKPVADITQEDAERLLPPPRNELRHLRGHLDQYRFRPQWDGERTQLKILGLEVVAEAVPETVDGTEI